MARRKHEVRAEPGKKGMYRVYGEKSDGGWEPLGLPTDETAARLAKVQLDFEARNDGPIIKKS